MKFKLGFSLVLGVILACSFFVNGQQVDSTFGTDGYIPFGITGNNEENRGIGYNSAIQPDGKIVTVIAKNDPNTHSDLDFYTYRYNPDGTPDATFGINGVSGIFAGDQSWNKDLKVQSDGKIVIIGQTEYCVLGVCGAPQFIMMRLNQDGSLDSTFGVNGKLITTDIFNTTGLYAIGERVFITSNNKFIIGGKGPGGKPFVARLKSNGFIDSTYAVDGIYSDTATYAFLKDIAIDNNENVYGVLLNYGAFDTLNISDVVVFKIDNNGNPDMSFGTNAHQKVNISNRDLPSSITVRNDGKVAIAGSYRPHYNGGFGTTDTGFLIVLNSDGSVSNLFPAGYLLIDIPGDSATFINKIITTQNDVMIMVGKTIVPTPSGNYEMKAFISCLDKNGLPFTSFNSTGIMKFDYGQHSVIGAQADFNDLDILPNGDFIATGCRNPIAHNVMQSVFLIKIDNSSMSTGISSLNENSFTARLYPTVSSSPTLEVSLTTSSNYSIKLLNVTGDLVYTFASEKNLQAGIISSKLEIPGGLSEGVYYVVVESLNQKIVKKFVFVRE